MSASFKKSYIFKEILIFSKYCGFNKYHHLKLCSVYIQCLLYSKKYLITKDNTT